MTITDTRKTHESHCHRLEPVNARKAPYALWPDSLPIRNSFITSGSPKISAQTIYKMMNAPPPFSPTIYGNFQMLPSPTALPAAANRTPIFDEKDLTISYSPFSTLYSNSKILMNPVSLKTLLMSSFTLRMTTLLPVDLALFKMLSRMRRPLEAI